MKLKQIMSSDVKSVTPECTVARAAESMRVNNVGCLPVLDGAELVGVVTDRDIVVRAIGTGQDPAVSHVADIMTSAPKSLNQESSVSEAVRLMRDTRIRRIPVLNNQQRLVGMVTLTDVALRAHEPIQSGSALACICAQPAMDG